MSMLKTALELVERHPWRDGDPDEGVWLGQYCINVTDIEKTIAFYELLGLTCTSRTEIPQALEAILTNPDQGGKIQLAQQTDQDGPIDMGSMWKLYVNTDDVEALHAKAIEAGIPKMVQRHIIETIDYSFTGSPQSITTRSTRPTEAGDEEAA